MKKTIEIEGMSCNHCIHAVREALSGIEGMEVLDVQIGSATIQFEDADLDTGRVHGAIEEEGYMVVGELPA